MVALVLYSAESLANLRDNVRTSRGQSQAEEVTMSSTGQQTRRNSDSAPAGRGQPADGRPGAPKGTGQAKMPPRRTWLWFVLVLLANYLLVRLLMPGPEGPVTVPYTLFKEEVRKGNVQAIYSQGDTITGRFKAPVTYPPAGEQSAAPSGEPQRRASEPGGADAPRPTRPKR